MKNRIYIILAFALTCFNAETFAQENKFAIGIEAGPNRTRLYGNDLLKELGESVTKFYGGLNFQFNLNKTLSIHSGVAFEQKGHHAEMKYIDYRDGSVIGTIIADYTFSYLTVPVMMRATFGQKIKYFGNVGPYFGYALKQRSRTESPQNPLEEKDESKMNKKTDYGISVGAGISYPVNPKVDINFEVRNNLGLVNISKIPVTDNGSIKTNAINFLFGCSYKFGARN